MEHRYSKRIIANLQALIYKSGLPIAIGRVRNVSKHGVFVDCAPDIAVLNQPLRIDFFASGRRMERSTGFMCFVVRKEIEGLALCLFDECQPAYAKYTESIVTQPNSPPIIPCLNFSSQNENINLAPPNYLSERA